MAAEDTQYMDRLDMDGDFEGGVEIGGEFFYACVSTAPLPRAPPGIHPHPVSHPDSPASPAQDGDTAGSGRC